MKHTLLSILAVAVIGTANAAPAPEYAYLPAVGERPNVSTQWVMLFGEPSTPIHKFLYALLPDLAEARDAVDVEQAFRSHKTWHIWKDVAKLKSNDPRQCAHLFLLAAADGDWGAVYSLSDAPEVQPFAAARIPVGDVELRFVSRTEGRETYALGDSVTIEVSPDPFGWGGWLVTRTTGLFGAPESAAPVPQLLRRIYETATAPGEPPDRSVIEAQVRDLIAALNSSN